MNIKVIEKNSHLDINRKLKMESNIVNLITYLANKTDMFW